MGDDGIWQVSLVWNILDIVFVGVDRIWQVILVWDIVDMTLSLLVMTGFGRLFWFGIS